MMRLASLAGPVAVTVWATILASQVGLTLWNGLAPLAQAFAQGAGLVP